MQRFLITEVILPKLDAPNILLFLGDVTKKLKNNMSSENEVEVWKGFQN
jgi:hypothetical protein